MRISFLQPKGSPPFELASQFLQNAAHPESEEDLTQAMSVLRLISRRKGTGLVGWAYELIFGMNVYIALFY
jgi:hypothetical protein